MENLDTLLNKIKKGEANITKIAKETGIPATRMYKWKDRDSDISLSDAKKLATWAGINLDNSLNTRKEDKDKTIADLAYSTRQLTDNNTELVQMHKQLLNKYVFNSDMPASASASSQGKEIVSSNPVEELQPGRPGKSSAGKYGSKKDNVADLGR